MVDGSGAAPCSRTEPGRATGSVAASNVGGTARRRRKKSGGGAGRGFDRPSLDDGVERHTGRVGNGGDVGAVPTTPARDVGLGGLVVGKQFVAAARGGVGAGGGGGEGALKRGPIVRNEWTGGGGRPGVAAGVVGVGPGGRGVEEIEKCVFTTLEIVAAQCGGGGGGRRTTRNRVGWSRGHAWGGEFVGPGGGGWQHGQHGQHVCVGHVGVDFFRVE